MEREQRRIEAQAERERRAAERGAATEEKQREQARVAGRKEVARERTVELEDRVLVQMSLPPREVVPAEKAHRYVERGDEDKVTVRPPREVADLYRDVVAQVVVLALRNLLASDLALQRVGINGHVRAIDPATGEWEYPCLVSVDVAREDFPREEALHNAAATLDSRPDLLDMSATNFEHLVRPLFGAQGAEGWTTTQSKDDGVDAVILNRSNLIGGLAVVQAKRYRPSNVLGPSQ